MQPVLTILIIWSIHNCRYTFTDIQWIRSVFYVLLHNIYIYIFLLQFSTIRYRIAFTVSCVTYLTINCSTRFFLHKSYIQTTPTWSFWRFSSGRSSLRLDAGLWPGSDFMNCFRPEFTDSMHTFVKIGSYVLLFRTLWSKNFALGKWLVKFLSAFFN
jgi:hypothetical protein